MTKERRTNEEASALRTIISELVEKSLEAGLGPNWTSIGRKLNVPMHTVVSYGTPTYRKFLRKERDGDNPIIQTRLNQPFHDFVHLVKPKLTMGEIQTLAAFVGYLKSGDNKSIPGYTS